jgi:capsule biosynthesis phosphatase
MHVIILCGGFGTRLEDYSLPKPLNMIHGKPSIVYCLQNIPSHVTDLHFIASPHLAKYNFEEIIKNQFKHKICHIHWIPYFTRGAVETALLGTNELANTDESLVFLDNDVIYNFPPDFFSDRHTAFLGYAKDKSSSEQYSFLTIDTNSRVTNYKEKRRISDNFCCGVYGFANIQQFRSVAKSVIDQQTNQSELYMSTLYSHFLENHVPIQAIHFEGDVYHIGSLKELSSSWNKINKPSMRICFDLDNTLVTYPVVPGDYRTVKPIHRMIELARKMKAEGHTIIIHTARRMMTHTHNVGAVLRDIGAITFQTLTDFDIPCDEILFGKPIADIYIDDRAVNPYRESVSSMGYIHHEYATPINMLPTNKHNQIVLLDNKVIKTGPSHFLRGEIFFYENISKDSALANYFPQFHGCVKGPEISQITLENIKGIPIYMLFKQGLLTKTHILQIFEFVDMLHNTEGTIPSVSDMTDNYTKKLQARFLREEDYPFSDARVIQEQCITDLSGYVPKGVGCIHGDLWFSNMILTLKNELKCIDMKGQVNGELVTGGDRMYDYGKLLQSILGYDTILYNDIIEESYRQQMMDLFLDEVRKRGISIPELKAVTHSLIIGTFHSISDINTKIRVWDFLKKQLT